LALVAQSVAVARRPVVAGTRTAPAVRLTRRTIKAERDECLPSPDDQSAARQSRPSGPHAGLSACGQRLR
ncbi:MAG: hypothetical protein KDI48_18165, partial [Xanthomonadales bacterium]|nr:hypothetical protein [Xanthomonadales bacterium]